MAKIYWELEEAVALIDLYIQNGSMPNISDEKLAELSCIYSKRAQKLGFPANSKFRNLAGLRMQLSCIHYVVTGGREGMSNASQVFYQAWALFKSKPDNFRQTLNRFYSLYDF